MAEGGGGSDGAGGAVALAGVGALEVSSSGFWLFTAAVYCRSLDQVPCGSDLSGVARQKVGARTNQRGSHVSLVSIPVIPNPNVREPR